jgi:hypothetical protein
MDKWDMIRALASQQKVSPSSRNEGQRFPLHKQSPVNSRRLFGMAGERCRSDPPWFSPERLRAIMPPAPAPGQTSARPEMFLEGHKPWNSA